MMLQENPREAVVPPPGVVQNFVPYGTKFCTGRQSCRQPAERTFGGKRPSSGKACVAQPQARKRNQKQDSPMKSARTSSLTLGAAVALLRVAVKRRWVRADEPGLVITRIAHQREAIFRPRTRRGSSIEAADARRRIVARKRFRLVTSAATKFPASQTIVARNPLRGSRLCS